MVVLEAMANSKRLAVLSHLIEMELSVTALNELVGLSQSALSQHLYKLRVGGLVTTRRDAPMIYYSRHSPVVLNMLRLLGDCFPSASVVSDGTVVIDELRIVVIIWAKMEGYLIMTVSGAPFEAHLKALSPLI